MNNSRAFPADMLIASPEIPSVEHVTGFERSWSYRLTCIALLLWWIASLYPLMAVYNVEERLQEAAEATENGSLPNQLLGISFAILGGFYLPSAMRALRTRQKVRSLFYLLGAYLLWSSATILWTDDVTLSIRRLGQLILLLIGAIGLGAGFYSRTPERTLTLARHILYASCITITVLIISRLWHQNLSELLNPDWNLKESTAAEYYIYPVAFGIIASLVLYRDDKTKQVLFVSLLGLVLLLLKGRAMIVGTLAVGLLISSRFAIHSLTRTIRFSIALILSFVQVDLASGARIFLFLVSFLVDSFSSLLAYLTVGRGLDDFLSLDGRVPLWRALWSYVEERPLIGHGFGAFWNPSRFEDIYREVSWHAVVAHNGFLDELLGTGLIGLLLFLIFWFACMRLTLYVTKQYRAAAYLVFGWLMLFLFFNSMGSILQSFFQSPTLISLTALFSLLALPQSSRAANKCGEGHQGVRSSVLHPTLRS